MDTTLLLSVVLPAVVVGTGLYLRSYLTKKGENLATREDLKDLTRRVEEVRAEFLRQQELDRHQLAKRLEEHRLSLQTELPVYRHLWQEMLALEAALTEVQVAYGATAAGPEDDTTRRRAWTAYTNAKERFYKEMRSVDPFLARPVHQKLFEAFIVVRRVALETEKVLSGANPDRQVLSDGIAQMSTAFAQLATAIRKRLFPEPEIAAGSEQ